MSQSDPQHKNLGYLEETLRCETRTVNIRLREGEYQFGLAKAIASFELDLNFPDVKDLVKKLFGEKKTEDLQFVSKVQTILKKMEKSGVIKILPKDKPWELQRYALTSFKFQDVEKELIVLAAKPEIDKTIGLIHTQPNPKPPMIALRRINVTKWILLLLFAVIGSYTMIIWVVSQPTVNILIFGSAFCVAAMCSVLLATLIAKKRQ